MSIIKIVHTKYNEKKNWQTKSHDCKSKSLKFMLG